MASSQSTHASGRTELRGAYKHPLNDFSRLDDGPLALLISFAGFRCGLRDGEISRISSDSMSERLPFSPFFHAGHFEPLTLKQI